jgi:D-cysteine desulfhydrase family pyridoxal phosphate-dependent enzyme
MIPTHDDHRRRSLMTQTVILDGARPETSQVDESALDSLPRLRLAQLPTPLEDAPRLSRELGGPRILFKRDDLTGAGLGGNKVRKLEFLLGRAVQEGADSLVVSGGFQSNLARITAALGNRLGLEVTLVLGGEAGESRLPRGNLLLDRLYGAKVVFVNTVPRWDFGTAVEDAAEDLRRAGKRPFVIPLGGSGPEGMAGYVSATSELCQQLAERRIDASRLYVAVGSGGTYSGLVLGAMKYAAPYRVVGISVSRASDYLLDHIPVAAAVAADQLGLIQRPEAKDLDLYDAYIGAGYGTITDGCSEAISLVARTEGIILDPVYSGKAMHGLIDHIKQGLVSSQDTVIFLHTGGWPALFSFDTAAFKISRG